MMCARKDKAHGTLRRLFSFKRPPAVRGIWRGASSRISVEASLVLACRADQARPWFNGERGLSER